MLTRRGWAAAGTAVGLALAAGLVGIAELYPVALALAALTAASLVWVRRRPWTLDTYRVVHPVRMGAGGTARVELVVRNRARRRSPVVDVEDPFSGTAGPARFSVAPLAGGQVTRAEYRLVPPRRGVYSLGPLRLRLTDPFGLAVTTTVGAPASTLTVHPPLERVSAPVVAPGSDRQALGGAAVVGARGDDFYALREYRVGDDLRRVHWASSARHDDLMIRQEQTMQQGRLVLLLDLREDVHTPESLETALEVAASVAEAALRAGTYVRVFSSAGADTGFASSLDHRGVVLDLLAAAGTHPSATLAHTLRHSARAGAGGSLILVTTDGVSPADVDAFGQVGLPTSYRAVIVERHPGAAPVAAPAGSLRLAAGSPFARTWERAVHSPVGGRR